MTQANLLAAHPGEHNARRRARITQCIARKDILGLYDATYGTRPLKADGTPCSQYVDRYLDYPAKQQITTLHRSLALAYSVQNRVTISFAEQATAYDAFVAYDEARLDIAA